MRKCTAKDEDDFIKQIESDTELTKELEQVKSLKKSVTQR